MAMQTHALIGTEWKNHQTDVHPVWEARTAPTHELVADWTTTQKIGFRFIFLYFLIQSLPIDRQFFINLSDFGTDYTRYLFNLSRYAPRFFGPLDTFANWGIVLVMAVAGTTIWSTRKNDKKNYPVLQYWLLVVLRYRLALGVIAYGFIKLFPLQAPLPSISNLNTAYGDFTAWKLFSLTLGIVPSYQSFLGGVELLGGLLLLNRKTTTIGTLVLLPFLGNVFFSNLAYEGGEYVYSGLLITFALMLFAQDAWRLFQLVSLELPTTPNRFRLALSGWQRYGRLSLKAAFVFFAVIVYGYSAYAVYRKGSVRFPQTAGLSGVAGIYDVSEFRLGNKTLPYSKTDPTRWQDVVFEKWNTISIKSNQPVTPLTRNVETLQRANSERDYEVAGSQGRHYYRYTVDAAHRRITLRNANPNEAKETLQLTYTLSSNGRITLSGIDEHANAERQDSIYAVLDKVNKKYLVDEAAKAGRRGALKL